MSDNILGKIDNKLEKISEDITDIKVTQARHDENLQDHMKRSDTLESLFKELYDDVEPLKADINKAKGAIKVVSILGAGLTFILGIFRLLGKL